MTSAEEELKPYLVVDPHEMSERVDALRRQGKRIGLVPTMGALHLGQLSLAIAAKNECDVTQRGLRQISANARRRYRPPLKNRNRLHLRAFRQRDVSSRFRRVCTRRRGFAALRRSFPSDAL